MKNCSLTGSSARIGGAVAAWVTALVDITGSSVMHNTAVERGGGLAFAENSLGCRSLKQLLIANNSVKGRGGGLALDDSAQVRSYDHVGSVLHLA
jgi:hypothetical protein